MSNGYKGGGGFEDVLLRKKKKFSHSILIPKILRPKEKFCSSHESLLTPTGKWNIFIYFPHLFQSELYGEIRLMIPALFTHLLLV